MLRTKQKYADAGIRTQNKKTLNYYVKDIKAKLQIDDVIYGHWVDIKKKYFKNTKNEFIKLFNDILETELEFNIHNYHDYIKKYFYLSKEYTSHAGSFDISLNTWLTPSLMNDLLLDKPETVVIKKSSQLGFTTIMLIFAILNILKRKQSVLYVLPIMDMVEVFWRTKVIPLFKNSEALKKYIICFDNQSKVIETTRGNLIFTYASSPSALASHSCPIIIMDEVSKYKNISESNPIELAKERSKTYKNKKHIIFSTPTIQDTLFEKMFNLYPIKSFFVTCPQCNDRFEVIFKDFIYDKELNKCYYKTPCEHIIIDNPSELCLLGDYDYISDNTENQYGISYIIPSYLSSFLTFNDIYRKYLDASDTASKDVIQSFENNYLAKTFDHSILRMKINIKNIIPEEIKKELQKPTIKMFTGVDVGDNFIYILSFITDIEDRSVPIIVVDYKKIDLRGEFTRILDEIINYKPYGHTPDRIGMDFGYKANELRLLFQNYVNLIPIRGRTTETIRNQKIIYNSNTKMIEIYSHFIKTKLATLMEQEKLLFFKATDKLIKHMASHECYLDPRDGTILWKSKFAEGYEDHYLDALVYAYVSYHISVEL